MPAMRGCTDLIFTVVVKYIVHRVLLLSGCYSPLYTFLQLYYTLTESFNHYDNHNWHSSKYMPKYRMDEHFENTIDGFTPIRLKSQSMMHLGRFINQVCTK